MLFSCAISMYPRKRSLFIAVVANPLLNGKHSFTEKTFVGIPSFMAGFTKIFRSIAFLIFVFDILNMFTLFFQLIFNICELFSCGTPKKIALTALPKIKLKRLSQNISIMTYLLCWDFITTKQGVKCEAICR